MACESVKRFKQGARNFTNVRRQTGKRQIT